MNDTFCLTNHDNQVSKNYKIMYKIVKNSFNSLPCDLFHSYILN